MLEYKRNSLLKEQPPVGSWRVARTRSKRGRPGAGRGGPCITFDGGKEGKKEGRKEGKQRNM